MNRLKTIPWLCIFFLPLNGSLQAQDPGELPPASDSVVVAASTRYAPAGLLRKLLTGKNYRKEWATPVALAVLDLEKTGLKIVRMGGGMQTKSLRLVDPQGREWALRTVDKFAEGALPPALRNTLAEKVVQDLISASYPFAAVTVGELAHAAGIKAPRPLVYFVPDDIFLGEHWEHFANTVCFLERRDPVPGTLETAELLNSKLNDGDKRMAQKEILKARLLDMLIADWDRHEGQWLWASSDSGGIEYYYAVPLDRDQAFFISNGLIPKLAKLLAMPHINHFKEESKNLKKLNFKSWEFDRFFLNGLNSQEWSNVISSFINDMNDEVIAGAVKKLPAGVYAISGEEIIKKLKSRRDGLQKSAMEYYDFLARAVNIAGTNKNEVFQVQGLGGGIRVTVYESIEGRTGPIIFQRDFDEDETRQVSFYGLHGDDQFTIDSSVGNTIKLRIYGDKGVDTYNIMGNVRSRIYDYKREISQIVSLGNAKMLYED